MEFIEKVGIKDGSVNHIIKNSYDIIMELIRAKMLIKGYSSSGKGAHEAEVSYLRNLDFSENKVQFINQLRYFRNGIVYYGKRFDKEYSKKSITFFKKIRKKLK